MKTTDNSKRRAEISSKLLEMGRALMDEGAKSNDFTIDQAGTMLMLVGTLILDIDDMLIFGELSAMFSAKKFLDASEGINALHKATLAKIIRDKNEKPTPRKRVSRKKPKDDESK